MTLNLAGIITAVVDHAKATGLFDRVQYAEQLNAPRKGLSSEIWLDTIDRAAGRSGLAATSGRVALIVRVQVPIARDPQTEIDTDMAAAVDALLTAYSADFTLGGLVAQVDVLGAYGVPLSGKGGYLTQGGMGRGGLATQGGYRIFDITLPLIKDDLWPQAE